MSSPLGIESLPPEQAQPLLDTWHAAIGQLPAGFAAWASLSATEPDLDGLRALLGGRFVGVQLAAGQLATPQAVDRLAPVLAVLEAANRPVLVHPGPARVAAAVPGWWPALVDYSAQLSAAWWAWRVAGRQNHSQLRICFVAGAGLAPLQHERFRHRAGRSVTLDRCTYVDTSSYGPQALDALIRALGIDAVVFGSDRPYAPAAVPDYFGAAAARAVHVTNPRRLLEGPTHDSRCTTNGTRAGPARSIARDDPPIAAELRPAPG
jgi:predicted TIM-barrel fold metal-dependent hydrolase